MALRRMALPKACGPSTEATGMSSEVIVARTPGRASAREVSMRVMRACACGLRSTWACSMPGMLTSTPNTACPVTLSTPSWRTGLVPTTFSSGAVTVIQSSSERRFSTDLRTRQRPRRRGVECRRALRFGERRARFTRGAPPLKARSTSAIRSSGRFRLATMHGVCPICARPLPRRLRWRRRRPGSAGLQRGHRAERCGGVSSVSCAGYQFTPHGRHGPIGSGPSLC